MRTRLLALPLLLVSFALIMAPSQGLAQFRGGGKGGPGGGLMGGGFDPARMFDMMARGNEYIQISETRMFRTQLEEFAREKGITNGQISREQFNSFGEQIKAKMASGDFSFFRPGGSSSPGQSITISTSPLSPSGITEGAGRFAESEFARRDRNEDGKLNLDEVPDSLRENFSRWDVNKDNVIDRTEYTAYFTARMQERIAKEERRNEPGPNTIIIEDTLDRRPVVFRAGKLPKDLPPWFQQMDTDLDGQVALYEWRKQRNDLDGFKNYDRNADGFLTAEEVLFQEAVAKNGNGGTTAGGSQRQMVAGGGMIAGGGEMFRRFGQNGPGGFGKGGFGPGGLGKGADWMRKKGR